MLKFIFLLFLNTQMLDAIELETVCKNLKQCVEWVSAKTSMKYKTGDLDRRSLKVEKELQTEGGDADFLFNYVLTQNDLFRVKIASDQYEILPMREFKGIHFQKPAKNDEISLLDFYTVEIEFQNKEKLKNATTILKKYLTKNGKIFEVAGANRLLVSDVGVQLYLIRLMANELNR